MYYRVSEVTMLKERFKKIIINLGSKIVKYLDISICLSDSEYKHMRGLGFAHYPS
ncbi:hypothetical protein ACJDT4_18440 [Clostridium neuense]|uniref:Uncharacterized protein n=1 Tax=Clostridium neuense TaxID=1728934 RepID=A0ABW8TJ90_9CLOT